MAPPLFMLGTGRSGTTLAFEMLAAHPDLAWFSNYESMFPASQLATHSRKVLELPWMWSRSARRASAYEVRPSETYSKLEGAFSGFAEPVRDLTAEDLTPWMSRRLRAILDHKLQTDGKDQLAFKYTGWGRIGFMQAMYPDARFIHIFRDIRAVANSLLQQRWWRGWQGPANWRWGPLSAEEQELWDSSDQSFLVLAGIQWVKCIQSIETAAAELPAEQFIRVRFEDLVSDKDAQMQRMLAFCGLPFNDAYQARLSGFEMKASARDRWKKDLTTSQVHTFERTMETYISWQDTLDSGGTSSEVS